MDIQFCNRFKNHLRFLSAVLVVLVLALFIAPKAFACHRNDRPHGKETSCGGSDLPPGFFFAEAYFEDEEGQFSSAPGLEFERSVNSNVDSGDYIANSADLGIVTINTRSYNKRVLKGKKDGDLCHAMNAGLHENGPLESIPDEFSYGWTDDCSEGQCAVEISLHFSGDDVFELSGGRSDQINIIMYTSISDSLVNDDPFTEVQALSIDIMEAEFNKLGTSRTLVQCQFLRGGIGPGLFHSTPKP